MQQFGRDIHQITIRFHREAGAMIVRNRCSVDLWMSFKRFCLWFPTEATEARSSFKGALTGTGKHPANSSYSVIELPLWCNALSIGTWKSRACTLGAGLLISSTTYNAAVKDTVPLLRIQASVVLWDRNSLRLYNLLGYFDFLGHIFATWVSSLVQVILPRTIPFRPYRISIG